MQPHLTERQRMILVDISMSTPAGGGGDTTAPPPPLLTRTPGTGSLALAPVDVTLVSNPGAFQQTLPATYLTRHAVGAPVDDAGVAVPNNNLATASGSTVVIALWSTGIGGPGTFEYRVRNAANPGLVLSGFTFVWTA